MVLDRPYLRRLERLTIWRYQSKGNALPAVILKPWELVWSGNLILACLEAYDLIQSENMKHVQF